MSLKHVCVLVPAILAAESLFAQDPTQPPTPPAGTPPAGSASRAIPIAPATTPQTTQPPGGNRAFGIFPNYRTADMSQVGTPLTPRQKFSIAAKDSFDYPTVLLAGAVAGIGQWNN